MMSKHFELIDETRKSFGVTVHRIRATRNLPHHGVKKGDLGGFVESVENLRDSAWCADNAVVMGWARVCENACVSGYARASGNAHIYGNAKITDQATVTGHASVCGNSHIADGALVSGRAHIYGDSLVHGSVAFYADSIVCDGDISHKKHVMTFDGVEFYGSQTTLHKTTDGHRLNIGSWSGTVDGLMGEIEQRRESIWKSFDFSEPVLDAMVAEYEALKRLCEARIARWKAEDAEEIGWVS